MTVVRMSKIEVVHLVAELVVAAKHDQTAPRDLVSANSYVHCSLFRP